MKLQFDVTFPAIRCSLLSLDTMDISGEQHFDIVCTAGSCFLIIIFLNTSNCVRNMPIVDFYHNHTASDQLAWMSCSLILLTDNLWHIYFQRHDIVKKRIDAHGNVIEAKKDGIGAPKVCGNTCCAIFFRKQWLHIVHVWIPVYIIW